MSKAGRLTASAANAILKSIRWRSYSTEYQVMVRHEGKGPNGNTIVYYQRATYTGWDGRSQQIHPQDTYREALEEVEKLREHDKPHAVIFRIKTERPA